MGRDAISRADVILHPQRMRMIRSLASGGRTVKDLVAELPEIPQATMYRHLALLLEAGVVEVVSERQVRATKERAYGLTKSTILSAEELATVSRDDHFRYFVTFLAGLLGEYGRYLDRPEIDLLRDGVGYREHVLELTDEELREMLGELRRILAAREGAPPRPGSVTRLFATVSMPLDRSADQRPGGEAQAPSGG